MMKAEKLSEHGKTNQYPNNNPQLLLLSIVIGTLVACFIILYIRVYYLMALIVPSIVSCFLVVIGPFRRICEMDMEVEKEREYELPKKAVQPSELTLTEKEKEWLGHFGKNIRPEAEAYLHDYKTRELPKGKYVLYQGGRFVRWCDRDWPLMKLAQKKREPYYIGYVGDTPFNFKKGEIDEVINCRYEDEYGPHPPRMYIKLKVDYEDNTEIVEFKIDTGSDTTTIAPKEAETLGLDPENGIDHTVKVAHERIGVKDYYLNISLDNESRPIQASVGLPKSLLGMDFLRDCRLVVDPPVCSINIHKTEQLDGENGEVISVPKRSFLSFTLEKINEKISGMFPT